MNKKKEIFNREKHGVLLPFSLTLFNITPEELKYLISCEINLNYSEVLYASKRWQNDTRALLFDLFISFVICSL